MLLTALRREYQFYRSQSENSRDLLISFIFYGMGMALVGIFLTAYLWNKTSSLTTVALFYIVSFCVLPFVFIANGILLRYVNIRWLYIFGLVMVGVSPVILVFASEVSIGLVVLLGVTDGISNGFYWANRNYLTVDVVPDASRNYFLGIQTAADTLSSVTLPILVGYFIDRVASSALGSADIAYKIVMLVGLAMFSYSAILLRDDKFRNPKLDAVLVKGTDKYWMLVRGVTIFHAMTEGLLFFLPVLVVLIFVGSEKELGIVETVTALLAAVVTYTLSRIAKEHQRASIIYLGASIMMLSAVIFAAIFNPIAALIFVAGKKIALPLLYVHVPTLWYEAIDRYVGNDEAAQYKYLVDIEIFLNIGRLAAICGFVWLVNSQGETSALRLAPVIMIFGQIGLVITANLLNRLLQAKRS